MQGAIVFIKQPINRQSKRAMIHEYDRIAEKLWPIEKQFYEAIFVGREYNDCYKEYQDWWKAQCEYIEKITTPKYFVIVSEYFSQKFAPEEKECVLPQASSLLRLARNVLKPIF